MSLERFAGPKEDLYTAVSKPLKKKPEPVKSRTTNLSYTKLSDLNVTNNPAAVAAATTTATTAPVVDETVTCVSSQQSYSEVAFDQRLELEPASKRESAADDEMWVTVKWRQQQEIIQKQQQEEQQQQQQHPEFERSMEDDVEAVALSLLGGGNPHHTEHIPMEDYSNLADINTGQAFVGEVMRTEEDSNKIYIDSNSGINGDNSIPSHDYVNHDTDDGKEEKQGKLKVSSAATYSEIDDITKKLDEKKRQQNGSLAAVPPMSDYVNTAPSPPPPPKV